jgi:hypothetical protein
MTPYLTQVLHRLDDQLSVDAERALESGEPHIAQEIARTRYRIAGAVEVASRPRVPAPAKVWLVVVAARIAVVRPESLELVACGSPERAEHIARAFTDGGRRADIHERVVQ